MERPDTMIERKIEEIKELSPTAYNFEVKDGRIYYDVDYYTLSNGYNGATHKSKPI